MVLPLDDVGWLANAVLVADDGSLLVGADAERRAAVVEAQRWVAQPGARLGEDIVVAGRRFEAADLVTALLRHVAACVASTVGATPSSVMVAAPAGWGPRRLAGLRRAAQVAGLDRVEVVTAPASVGWHLLCGGAALPYGATLLVCEVDTAGTSGTAGTACTATVLRRAVNGFDVLSCVDTATVVADLGAAGATPPRQRDAVEDLRTPPVPASAGDASRAGDGMSPQAGAGGDAGPAGGLIGEVVRRAVDGSAIAPGRLTLVCAAGAGAADVSVGTQLRAAAGVEPFLVAEAELAAALGALRSPPPGRRPTATPVSEPVTSPVPDRQGRVAGQAGWRDVAAALVPALWSVVLFGQFMAGSERYGPRQSIDAAMLLAAWGGLAFAATFGLIAAVGGLMLVTAARHEEAGAPVWVRHRLLAVSLAGGGVGGLVLAAVYATVAAGYFDLESGPLLRWSVLPVLPGMAAVLAVAVVVWRRPDPPRGSWLDWLRFPSPVTALVGFGAWLISYDERSSPAVLKLLEWQLQQWVTPSSEIIGPVGRLGGLCVGAGVGLLLARRTLHRLLLAVPLAALVAGSLGWRTTGMVAAGFAFAVAGWWAARAVWLLLRRLLLVPPTGWLASPASPVPVPAAAGITAGQGRSPHPAAAPHGDVSGSRWTG
ncbi:hypothetical protein OHA72_10230 [Dactylosporangium sp. NBC_01737]|uniref:hypothetical protein n=1 Tax=Dactylosporangium sp. NBC_01737 TaxID=2975959 RepID=UPI002E0E1615|nr:hypothetical protein OHA72_10230 [Dactylosporangium sp. NBC_01737]